MYWIVALDLLNRDPLMLEVSPLSEASESPKLSLLGWDCPVVVPHTEMISHEIGSRLAEDVVFKYSLR